jgi:predicted AAA+ superfamily ATPase
MRYLSEEIREDLKTKMVFVGGPRQVGKTTLALELLGSTSNTHSAYMNWDDPVARRKIIKLEIPANESLVIFDELHKYGKWRNWIKGLYDTRKSNQNYLITGSARLDVYRRGGDSLQGRYHYWRLHPFTLAEIDKTFSRASVDDLLKFGGFPEPFTKSDERFWRRWQIERLSTIVREDIRELERVNDLSAIEQLAAELPVRVGSPLSIKSLREDLEIAHDTAERWVKILESMYYCFRIAPLGARKIRAVKKEQKLYLWDHSLVEDPGSKFENLVASQLLKYCHYQQDCNGHRMDLRFLRDTDGREVDFVVIKDGKAEFAVECKTGEKSLSKSICYFQQRTPIPRFFQTHLGNADYMHATTGIRVLPFHVLCKELQLP